MYENKDYCVQAELSFLLDPGSGGEADAQLSPDIQKAFTEHVTDVFKKDKILWENTIDCPEFQFDGYRVRVKYLFAYCGPSEEMAECFSADHARHVQPQLETFGCKLEKVECMAGEVCMEYEETVVPSRIQESPKEKDHTPTHQNKGKKRSNWER